MFIRHIFLYLKLTTLELTNSHIYLINKLNDYFYYPETIKI